MIRAITNSSWASILSVCVLLNVPNFAAIAQEPNDIQLERSVYFAGADGKTIQVSVGQYSVTASESDVMMLVGESVTHRVRGTQYDHSEKLDMANAVSFNPGESEHHILLLRPDGTGLVVVGSYSGVATRAARFGVPIRTATYKSNVRMALDRRWTLIAARVRVQQKPIPVQQKPIRVQQKPIRAAAVRPPRAAAIVDNTFTITNNATGGDCRAMGQGVNWNNSARECIISAYTLEADKTLEILPGATVRVTGEFQSHGRITNEGSLLIGHYPPPNDPVATAKLFVAKITNYGLIENKAAAKAQCFTRAYWANEERTTNAYGGKVVNDGLLVVDCRFTHRGKEIVNNGQFFLRYGTQEPGQHHSKAMPADQGKNFWGLTINRDVIRQDASVVLDNRSTVENYGTYLFSNGAFFKNMLLDSHFYNICGGTSPGIVITGQARDPSWSTENRDAPQYIDTPRIETKPCDADNDGIPDSQDQCPNDPETFNGMMDSDGCPDTGGSYP